MITIQVCIEVFYFRYINRLQSDIRDNISSDDLMAKSVEQFSLYVLHVFLVIFILIKCVNNWYLKILFYSIQFEYIYLRMQHPGIFHHWLHLFVAIVIGQQYLEERFRRQNFWKLEQNKRFLKNCTDLLNNCIPAAICVIQKSQ